MLSTPAKTHLMRFLTLALLLGLLGVSALPAKEDPSEDIPNDPGEEPTDASECGYLEVPIAAILDAAASGTDIVVDIGWASDPLLLPPFANLVLKDGAGLVLGSLNFAPVAGATTTHTFSWVLAGVPIHGPQFELRLEDPLAQPITTDMDLRATLDCTGGICDYRLVEGLRADWVAISGELMQALDAVIGGGSTDILNDALTAAPTIEGEILGLAMQLGQLHAAVPLDQTPCTCVWMPAHATWNNAPGSFTLSQSNYEKRFTHSSQQWRQASLFLPRPSKL